MKNKVKSLLLCLAVVGLFTACESKFNEQKPEGIASADTQLKERVSANASLDEKINQVEKSALRLKSVISLFRKLQKNDDTSYTPVDLVVDLSEELKRGLPQGVAGLYSKQGQIRIPISNLSPECQKVDAIFKTVDAKSTQSESGDVKVELTAIISMKTCFSKDYLEAFEIHSQGANLSIVMKPEAFKKLFVNFLPEIPEEVSKLASLCNFSSDEQGIVTQVSCNQLGVPLSDTESVFLDTLNYNVVGDTRFEGSGKIYGQQGLKSLLYLKVKSDGTPIFKLDKVDPVTPEVTQAPSEKK